MDLGLSNKAAIVTGASEGIGYAVALGLAQEGARVAICARNPEKLDAATQEIREQTNTELISMAADMSQPADVSRFVGSVLSAWQTWWSFWRQSGPAISPGRPLPSTADSVVGCINEPRRSSAVSPPRSPRTLRSL